MPKLIGGKLLSNFISLGTVQATSSLVQIIVIPHVISRVGVDGYGAISVAQVVMFYLAVMTDYSFNQTATRAVSINRTELEQLSLIFSRVFFSRLFLCLLAMVFLALLIAVIPYFRDQMKLYSAGFVFVIGHSLMVNWFFQGLEKMHFIAYVTLVARVLFAVLVFIYVQSVNDGYMFLFFFGIGNIVAAFVSILVVVRKYKIHFTWPGIETIFSELREGWQIATSHLSNAICNYSNIFILRIFTNDLVTGYYSVAERIFLAIRQVFVVYSQAVYPALCQWLQEGRTWALATLRKSFSVFFVLVITGSCLLFVLAPIVLQFFMGDQYMHAVFYLRMFSIIALVVCLNIPGSLILLAENQKKKYLRLYFTASVINLLLNSVLAYYFQADGTVTSILITECIITITVTRLVHRMQISEVESGRGNLVS